MNNLTPRFAKQNSVALIVLLAGLIWISGLIATMLIVTDGSTENSEPRVKANQNPSSDEKPNANEPAPAPGNLNESPRQRVVIGGNPNASVWVNTSSGIYHCPNTRWYGNTKHGEYMTQQEAQTKGYRAAQGNPCG